MTKKSEDSSETEFDAPVPKEDTKKNVIVATAEFLEDRVVVWNKDEGNKIYSERYFGKWVEEGKVKSLLLSLEEAMHLVQRNLLAVKRNGKLLSAEELMVLCVSIDKEFSYKFAVYRDLRNRGFIVKSGFKFGTHFRVYDRGVNPYKEGSKEAKEHTKYNVHAVPENHTMSYQEWSRYVRLSHNIKATALLAVVDEEGDVTYYKITRVRP